jgi:hypothetical protein
MEIIQKVISSFFNPIVLILALITGVIGLIIEKARLSCSHKDEP